MADKTTEIREQDRPFGERTKEGSERVLRETLETAEALLQVLRREKEALENMESDEIMALLPHKESLARRMSAMVERLDRDVPSFRHDSTPVSMALRERLTEIRLIHEYTRTFVEGLTNFWRDFAKIFAPPGYGPPASGNAAAASYLKGLSISKEA